MKVLLLAGCQSNIDSLVQDHYGEPLIDFQINKLLGYGYEVTIVVSGDQADDLLRSSRSIKYCELVFDANKDGNIDIYVSSGGYHNYESNDILLKDRLYFGDGNGNFEFCN